MRLAWLLAFVWTLPLRAATGGDETVRLQNLPGGLYEVQGNFHTARPLQAVWDLLSGYDDLTATVSSLVRSQVLERQGDHLLVEQSARASFLFFSRTVHVRLRILECKPLSIAFDDESKRDFQVYRGRWDLEPSPGGGTEVRYQLTASRGRLAPELIEEHVFKGQAASLLAEIKAQLQKRADTNAGDQHGTD